MEERKTGEFETEEGKWRISFDIKTGPMGRGNSNVLVSFVINRKNYGYLKEEDIQELKRDLKDLGKLRIIKKGRGFLESWKKEK